MNYIILSKDLNLINDSQYNSLCDALEIAWKLLTAYCNGIINNNGINKLGE